MNGDGVYDCAADCWIVRPQTADRRPKTLGRIMSRDFKNIKAWQHADDLVFQVYAKTKDFPKEELYGLTSQIHRSAVSVPTNIAEGASRQYKREYLQFLYVARGSLVETEYLLHVSHRLKYLTDAEYKEIEVLREESAKTLYGLIAAVEKETRFTAKLLAFIISMIIINSAKVFGLWSSV